MELPRTGPVKPFLPSVSFGWAAFAVAAWILAVDNTSFWGGLLRAQGERWLTSLPALAALAGVLALLLTSTLRAATYPWLAKPLWVALLVLSAAAAHFLDRWGVLIDKGMIRNILQTDFSEASDLFNASLAADLVLRGLLPALAVAFMPLAPAKIASRLGGTLLWLLTALVALALALAAFYPIYSTTFRNHRELRLQLVPSNYLAGVYGVLKPKRDTVLVTVGADARRQPRDSARPLLVVVVVGETARADNFSLAGYPRPTNDVLAGRDFTFFSNVTSCGTDTATSVPCMFSDLGSDRFSADSAAQRENVLDVLKRTGVKVSWLDNNSGCKGVCGRVETVDLSRSPSCAGSQCQDDVLVAALKERLPTVQSDALVVLHQQGSHGPAYYKRYPAPGRFQPTCTTNRIQDCSREALVNAYDNTIDYTSRVLASAIDLLVTDQGRDTLILYISDHGESLGERGIYLHGLPRILAPHEQSHVPMLLWMSEGAQRRLLPAGGCMSALAARGFSHDNLFHTLLGAFAVDSSVYRAKLDILALANDASECVTPPPRLAKSHTS